MKRTREYRIKRINKLLLKYMDNPGHRNAKKLIARKLYIFNNKDK